MGDVFLENIDSKKEINHKNGIKKDNRLENLEWNTKSENIKHAWFNGLIAINSSFAQEKNKKISIEETLYLIRIYGTSMFSAKKEALRLGVAISSIYANIYRNKRRLQQ